MPTSQLSERIIKGNLRLEEINTQALKDLFLLMTTWNDKSTDNLSRNGSAIVTLRVCSRENWWMLDDLMNSANNKFEE